MKIGIDGRALIKNKVGLGNYLSEIVKELNESDKENEYIIYANKEIYLDYKLNDNWKISIYKNHIPGTFWLYYFLPQILKKDKIDVFWGTQHILPKRNLNTKNIKFIVTVHDIAIIKLKNVGSRYNTIVQKMFLKKSCNNANKIIAISKCTKNDLIDWLNCDNKKIQVIYNGCNKKNILNISEEEYKQIKEKYDLNKNRFIFFLSTIEPRKNLNTLIKAFELTKQNRKYGDLKLIIAGGLGWKYANILQLYNNSKYKEDIIMPGYISNKEKIAFYKNCEFFSYPSLYEGFGLPILEAMKYGSLVLTAKNSSLSEIGGNAAVYYENAKDEEELKNAISKCLNMSKQDKNKFIKLGYKQIEKFSWKEAANDIANIFNNKKD